MPRSPKSRRCWRGYRSGAALSATQAPPSIIDSYVRNGKVKIEYRSMETATRDPDTFDIQQVAALAAGQQDKLWNFIELFYHEQGKEDSGYVTESFLQG